MWADGIIADAEADYLFGGHSILYQPPIIVMFAKYLKNLVAATLVCFCMGLAFSSVSAMDGDPDDAEAGEAIACEENILSMEFAVTSDNSLTKTSEKLTGDCDAIDWLVKMGNVIDDSAAVVRHTFLEVEDDGDVKTLHSGRKCDGNGDGFFGDASGENCGTHYDDGEQNPGGERIDSGSKIRVRVEDTDCPISDCGNAQISISAQPTPD